MMMMMMMMMTLMTLMIISPFDQLGLWAPFSGVRDVFTSTAYVVKSLSVIEESGHPCYGPLVAVQFPGGGLEFEA
jgi:hypothetical protein